ncbi:MAG: beta-ketoacyl-[acyl-carrier-protein] synthase family protein [Acidobacteria bacterium]|nr:beta-ketoacyl-[acyl-carrier-protein] synthase family protein [Acidobacteriota bacterium]
MSSRIVATGAGVISSIGAGTEEFAEALYAARSGIAPCGLLEPEGPAAAAAAIRDFAPERWLGAKGLRVLDRSARLLCVAAQMALSSSGLAGLTAEEDTDSRGLVCGTMFGGVHSIVAFDWSGLTEGPKYVNPMDFPNTVINSPAGQAAIRFKLRGINSTISSGLASGLYAIHYAAEFLRLGRASALLAGGVEELCQESLLGFIKNGLISPRGRIFPFSADGGDGTIPGEGSALWVLETEERARARGVKPLAEVCGFGAAHDARSINAYHPEADGATAAVLGALQASGIPPEAIGLIVASANGSRGGDAMELRALSRVFGSRLEQIPVCAPKAAFGEALGASGALLALTGGMALQRRLAPPTVAVAGAARGLRLLQHPERLEAEYALVNCFGCDGNNASLVLRRWPE